MVIVKYTELVKDRGAFAKEALNLFKPLTKIEGIHEVSVIEGLPLRENRYDLIIQIDMDKTALPQYDESPEHKKWKTDYAKYVKSKAIFDCEG